MTAEEFLHSTQSREGDRSREIAKLPEAEVLAWENTPASAYSPGVVLNEERVLRALDQPTHWNRVKNEFRPQAFTEAETHGLSVRRPSHCDIEDIATSAEARLIGREGKQDGIPEPRRLLGFAEFSCASLRSERISTAQQSEPERIFIVLDTANDGDAVERAHADVFVRAQHGVLRKRGRSLLFEWAKGGLRTEKDQAVGLAEFAEIARLQIG